MFLKIKVGIAFLCLIVNLAFADSEWPAIKKVGNGVYDFDGVTIDRINSKIEFKMISNQNNGLIEYAIVHENGKVHESLFRTATRPQILHASLLLLKAKPEKNSFRISI